jgi:hypothetical protein
MTVLPDNLIEEIAVAAAQRARSKVHLTINDLDQDHATRVLISCLVEVITYGPEREDKWRLAEALKAISQGVRFAGKARKRQAHRLCPSVQAAPQETALNTSTGPLTPKLQL